MINIKWSRFYVSMLLMIITFPIFSGKVNQSINNDPESESSDKNLVQSNKNIINKAKKRSKFKRRYKPKINEENEIREEIVNIAKLNPLNIPLKALCLNNLINNDHIDKEAQERIGAHDMSELLQTVEGIENSGYRNRKLVELLIRLTHDLDYKPTCLIPLQKNLREAVFLGDKIAALKLIEKGALQRVYDSTDEIPTLNIAIKGALRKATEKNLLEVVKQLLDNLNNDDDDTKDAIDWGLSYAKTPEMLCLYLEINADLNADCNPTCLERAVLDSNLEFIDFLLKHGATPLIGCERAESFKNGTTCAVTYALKKIKNGNSLEKEKGKEILKKFAQYPFEGYPNVLMIIILNHHISEDIATEAVSLILELNVIDIDDQDNGYENTALMFAVEYQLYKIVEILLAHHANILLINSEGEAALDIAKRFTYLQTLSPEKGSLGIKIFELLQKAKIVRPDESIFKH